MGDSDARKAARWVCNVSQTTRNNVAEITLSERMIEIVVQHATPMNQMRNLDLIKQMLLLGGGHTGPRGPVPLPMPSALPSSVGGRVLLEGAVTFI